MLTINGDDYVAVVDDVEYHPHAGETVTFKPGMSPEDYEVLLAFKSMSSMAAQRGDEVDMEGMINNINKVVDVLGSGIRSWTWTDSSDVPLPPPNADVLKTIELEELVWMVTARLSAKTGSQTPKND